MTDNSATPLGDSAALARIEAEIKTLIQRVDKLEQVNAKEAEERRKDQYRRKV